MKLLLTLTMVFSLSQAYGQMIGAPATTPATNSTMPGTINNNTNQPTFGNRVPNTGTTTGVNRNTNPNMDSVGTGQSSTTRTVLPNTPGTITPANSNATGVNCVDSSGRNYGSRDSGYTACVNSMRTR